MSECKIGDRIVLINTCSEKLEGAIGTIVGTHASHFPIILFDEPPPEGYDPAICIIESCIIPAPPLEERKRTYVYRIRHTVTGMFSKGGTHPYFTDRGKVWKARHHVSSHLAQVSRYSGNNSVYHDAEVVEYQVSEEIPIKTVPVNVWAAEIEQKRKIRQEKEHQSLEERRRHDRLKQYEVLRAEFDREFNSGLI